MDIAYKKNFIEDATIDCKDIDPMSIEYDSWQNYWDDGYTFFCKQIGKKLTDEEFQGILFAHNLSWENWKAQYDESKKIKTEMFK